MGLTMLPGGVTPQMYDDWSRNSPEGRAYAARVAASVRDTPYSAGPSHAPPVKDIMAWNNRRYGYSDPQAPQKRVQDQADRDMMAQFVKRNAGANQYIDDKVMQKSKKDMEAAKKREKLSRAAGLPYDINQRNFGFSTSPLAGGGMPAMSPAGVPAASPMAPKPFLSQKESGVIGVVPNPEYGRYYGVVWDGKSWVDGSDRQLAMDAAREQMAYERQRRELELQKLRDEMAYDKWARDQKMGIGPQPVSNAPREETMTERLNRELEAETRAVNSQSWDAARKTQAEQQARADWARDRRRPAAPSAPPGPSTPTNGSMHPDFIGPPANSVQLGGPVVFWHKPATGEEITMPNPNYRPRPGTGWVEGRMSQAAEYSPGRARPIPPQSPGNPIGQQPPAPQPAPAPPPPTPTPAPPPPSPQDALIDRLNTQPFQGVARPPIPLAGLMSADSYGRPAPQTDARRRLAQQGFVF